jgi:hypothetical protein
MKIHNSTARSAMIAQRARVRRPAFLAGIRTA